MIHEPECDANDCNCPSGPACADCFMCICDRLRRAFRRGYNAHAASVAHWEATHGAYQQQHGAGLENP